MLGLIFALLITYYIPRNTLICGHFVSILTNYPVQMGSVERDDVGGDAERVHHSRVFEMEAQLRRRQPQHFHQVHRFARQRYQVRLPVQRHSRRQTRLG